MKHIKFLFILAIISSGYLTAKGQGYVGSPAGFFLPTSYNNKITVAPNTTTTTIKFTVAYTRVNNGAADNWKPFKMNFKLGTDLGGSQELLPTVYPVTSDDFYPRVGSGTKEFTAVISNDKLRNNAYLIIGYNIPNVNNGGVLDINYTVYTGNRYFISLAPTTPTVDPNIAKISAMGFSTDGLQTFPTYYLVEGDIRLNKDALSQNKTNYTIDNTYSHNVNILIDEALMPTNNVPTPASYLYSNTINAVRVWNSNNSDIKLNLIAGRDNYPASTRIDISIKGSSSIPFLTESEFPKGDGKPGSLIVFNNSPNSQHTIRDIIHAIGHNLGLKHTPFNEPSYQNSVMNQAGNNITIPFPNSTGSYIFPSSYDINSIAAMYPVNNNSIVTPTIVGRQTLSSNFEQNSWFLSYISNEPGINYHWKVIRPDGTIYYDSPNNESSISELGGMPKGTYQLQCTISGGKYLTPVTLTKDIIEL